MSWEFWYTATVLAIVSVALISNRMGMDVAMLGGLVLLMLAGVLDVTSAVKGFASTAVLMLGGLFIVASGIERTGALSTVARRVLGRPRSVGEAQVRLMAPVSVLSGVMSNTAVVAVCIPIVRRWARRLGVSPSHLLLPLSFAAILGGKLTLIGTATNIIVMEDFVTWWQAMPSWATGLGAVPPSPVLEFFGVALIGLPCLVVGILLIVLLSSRLLPARVGPTATDVLDARKYQVELVVQEDSPIVGHSIERAGLRNLPGLFLGGVERAGVPLPTVAPDTVLEAGDRLAFVGLLESVLDLRQIRGLVPADQQAEKLDVTPTRRTLVEAVVSANSPLVSKTVRGARFRSRYSAVILAVHRQGQQVNRKIGDIVLKTGDTLLLETHKGFRSTWHCSDEFFLISDVPEGTPVRHARAPIALAILAALVVLLVFAPIDRVVAVWACALAMVLSRCTTGTEARTNINWQVLLVIGAALGMAEAVRATGIADLLGSALATVGGGAGVAGALFILFLAATVASQFVTAYASAALLFPVTIEMAQSMQVAPAAFVFVLMVASGYSFLTPIGYQTNLMVYGPGGYRFLDFARIGVPLTLVLAVTCALLAPMIYGV